MNNQMQTTNSGGSLAKLDDATMSTLRNSVFPGATDDSIAMAVSYCQARKLDVLKKPVHIVPMSVKNQMNGQYEWRDVIMPGIAELRTTASRAKSYAGQDAPIFGEVKQFNIGGVKVSVPESCTMTVYKIIGGERVPFSHTEFFEEACATKKDGGLNAMWKKRPRGQLSKCAEAGALRKAFPEDLGGEISYDEVIEGHGNDSVVEAINPITDETKESLKKGVSAIGDQMSDFLKQNSVNELSELTEERGQELLKALRVRFKTKQLSQQDTHVNSPPVNDVPESTYEEVDY